ncbi:hypothetical protein DFQ27_002563 [Actinomortierella ambigua]|uniref:RNI-like protein n=1 Tax=Actinomortierella ambigua TaxID=1343610 RepID=A0A9P6U611_9FUNG|nr:hypothetical protein DFQ27_002563 [Actinomortierella ambigua]
MKRATSSSSGSANKKQRSSSSTSGSRRRGRGQSTSRGSIQARSRTASSESDEEDINDRQEAARQMILASATNRYDSLSLDLLTTTVHIMEPTPDSLPYAAPPSHQSGLHALLMNNGGGREKQQTKHLDGNNNNDDDPISSQVVHSLASWAMYSIAQNFHLLAAAAASPEGLVRPEFDRHPVSSQSGDPHPTTQHRDLTVQQQQLQNRRYRSACAIRDMPQHLSQKLFKLLRMTRPEILSTSVWTRMFFSQPWMESAGYPTQISHAGEQPQKDVHPLYVLDLEGLDPSQVLDPTIRSSFFLRTPGVIGPQLEMINLNQMTQLSDSCLASLVGQCSNLRRLFLKACVKVGDLTLAALPEVSLEELNISFVKEPSRTALQRMMYQCRELRVLKMAGVASVGDSWLVKLREAFDAEQQEQQQQQQQQSPSQSEQNAPSATPESWPLQYLQNLKISHTGLGDRGLKAILGFCGRTLERLDISSTNVTKVGLIADYCTWEDDDDDDDESYEAEEARSGQPYKNGNNPNNRKKKASKKHRRQGLIRNRLTRLVKLNLTRVKVQSINELTKLLGAIPPGSLHTLLLGYLSVSAIALRDTDLARLVPFFREWTREPHSGAGGGGGVARAVTGPFASAMATTWLGARHGLDSSTFRHIHTLSFFGCTQQVVRHHLGQGDSLRMVLQIFAPHLRRLELGWTNVQAIQLEAILLRAVPLPSRGDSPGLENDYGDHINNSGNDDDDDMGHEEPLVKQPNWVLEELGLDGCTLTQEMVDILILCRRLERVSLMSARVDNQDQVERLVRACPRLKSLDLTGCRGIDLGLRRTMLQHVRGNGVLPP